MKNKYFKTALSIYINYIIVGVSVMIFSLNMDFLCSQWGTDKVGFGLVTSGIGIGKFVVVLFAGAISDKIGRKPNILAGMVFFIISLAGVILSPNVTIAMIFAIVAGMANAITDTGSMPALMEAYPQSPGTATLIIKVWIAVAQFALPILVSFIIVNKLYYGISFYILIGILALNLLFMLKVKFPPMATKDSIGNNNGTVEFKEPAKPMIEGVALTLYGYTCISGLQIMSLWTAKIGEEVSGMSASSATTLISYFSIGTIVAVFITAFLVKSIIRPTAILFIHPIISVIMSAIWYISPTPLVSAIASFVMGYTIAGGIYQLAITSLSSFFPGNGGKATGIITAMNSIALWTVPLYTGVMAENNVKSIILCLGIISSVSIVLGFITMVRDRKVFGTASN